MLSYVDIKNKMISIALVTLLGMLVGVAAGLLPALPVFTGPMILYLFVNNNYPILHLLIFWMVSYSGTQFFGSIATITTKIPGEESSAIYLPDIDRLGIEEKKHLLFDTAVGSFVAGTFSILLVWTIVMFVNPNIFPALLGYQIQLIAYLFAIFLLILSGKPRWASILLIIAGLMIGPKQNYALPVWWYDLTFFFSGYTLYMIVLGTILIPSLFVPARQISTISEYTIKSKIPNIWIIIKSTVIGIFAGIVPGASASIATTLAYNTQKESNNSPYNKILAAETANNAAVVIVAIPFFILGLPINQNTLLMSNIMDIQSLNIIEEITKVITPLTLVMLIAFVLYFWLSTHLINWYANTVNILHNKMKWIVAIILLVLITADLQYSEITLYRYCYLLIGFTIFGFVIRFFKWSAIPFLFAVVLSDKFVWLGVQTINFIVSK